MNTIKALMFGNRFISFLTGIFIGFLLGSAIAIWETEKVVVPNLKEENAELRDMYYDAVIEREQAKAALVKYLQDNR